VGFQIAVNGELEHPAWSRIGCETAQLATPTGELERALSDDRRAEAAAPSSRRDWRDWCWGSTPHRADAGRRTRHTEIHGPRDLDTALRRQGFDGQADRSAPVELARYAIEHGLDEE
jgi:hypothetical protein